MDLRILGCSGGEAEGNRLTGLLVNGALAIDAGSLTQALTVPEQAAIRQIFISHSHLDHVCTLPFFTKNIYGKVTRPVQIHALPETLDALRRHLFNDEIWPDFSVIPSPEHPVIRFSEITSGRTYELEGLRVTPIPVDHLVPCVGYLVEDDHSAFIFSSDTGPTDELYEVANRTKHLKLFITEVSFPNDQARLAKASRHLTPRQLAQELKKLKVKVPVGIYHLTPGDREVILPQLSALKDPRLQVLQQDATFSW
jgi:ribonuclease BN (tRNA processing enzyme)